MHLKYYSIIISPEWIRLKVTRIVIVYSKRTHETLTLSLYVAMSCLKKNYIHQKAEIP